MADPLLAVSDLRTYFGRDGGTVRAVDGVDLSLAAGETLGIVGESGCGKSLTCLSIMRLVDEPGRIQPGSSIRLRGLELTELPEREMRGIRGNDISMIFQEPMTSLNPVWTVGDQIAESLRIHRGAGSAAARERAVEMLRLVGMPDPGSRVDSYPHELSGGMRQRAMIAMALVCEPAVLLADEPTTALDVTIQAEILELLARLRDTLGMAMVFVSHDLGVVSRVADRVAVMYAGQVVEVGTADDVLGRPRHPYTEGLLEALPRLERRVRRLAVIPGEVPNPRRWPTGCRFHPRCPYAWERCQEAPPLMEGEGEGEGEERRQRERAGPGSRHASRCWMVSEQSPKGAMGHGV